jgi:hypothetical protein
MKVKINVTKTLLKKGKAGNALSCPVALAFKPVLKKGVEPWVSFNINTQTSFVWLSASTLADVALPLEAQRLVAAIDNKRKAKPLSFEVDIPEEYLKREMRQVRRNRKAR